MTDSAAGSGDTTELTRGERAKRIDARLTGAGLRRSLEFRLEDWERLLALAGIEAPGERDEDPRYEAVVLDRAAGVLASRYGLLVAGDLIGGLRNRADALRNLRVKVEAEAEGEGDAEEPGHGYWEAGDL